jgi:ERCC4-type nuclease
MTIKSVLIDSREPPRIQSLTFGDVPIMVTQLQAGDLWIACEDGVTVIVERKTPADLLESIRDNRLFNQAAKMKELSQWCYLVCDEPILPHENGVMVDTKQRDWSFASIQGALLSVQEMGCHVVFCKDRDDFGPCIERLAKRSRSSVKIPPTREPYVISPQENVLLALPGIGSKKALDYLGLFGGNLAMALMALTAEHDGKTNHIPGYGQRSRDNVVGFLGGKLEYIANAD